MKKKETGCADLLGHPSKGIDPATIGDEVNLMAAEGSRLLAANIEAVNAQLLAEAEELEQKAEEQGKALADSMKDEEALCCSSLLPGADLAADLVDLSADL